MFLDTNSAIREARKFLKKAFEKEEKHLKKKKSILKDEKAFENK